MGETDDADLRYAEEFSRLSQELHEGGDRLSTIEKIVEAAQDAIDACDWSAVTVWRPSGHVETAASTGTTASRADALQYELRQGPCLEAIWQMGVFMIANLPEEPRWPDWSPQAAALGIGSVLSVEIDSMGDSRHAALNLYSATPFAFDQTDAMLATIFARHAASALHGARRQDELWEAARSRQVIGVAQGILMQRFGLTLDQSFELLRRYSQTHNTKLRVLAENLVRSGGIRDEAGVHAVLKDTLGLNPHQEHPTD
jgi:GAF domain-containing protein